MYSILDKNHMKSNVRRLCMKYLQRLVFSLFTLFLFSPALFSQTAESAAEHAQRRAPTFWDFLVHPRFVFKFSVMLVLGIVVLVLLKTKKMNKATKVVLLLLATFLFGLLGNVFDYFAMHPSPMCAATKSLLYGFGIPLIITLVVIFLLTLIGPKLFCGWVCPVGAVQELIAMLADKLGIKRNQFSFTVAQTVRFLIFILFIFLSATAVIHGVFEGRTYAISIYDYINPFHGMEFGANEDLLGYLIHYLPFLLTVILAFKYYRPFCHFVCPIGLYTHFLEQIALFRITFKKNTCTDCNICLKKTPCTAIPEIMKESVLRPDCYACNDCIEKCLEDSFEIGIKRTV
jgi:polyferredoxin